MTDKEYKHRWYIENKDRILELRKNYQLNNKSLISNRKKLYRKKYPWISIYRHIYYRCNNKNDISYLNYGAKGIKCNITIDEIKKLWFRDKAYNLNRPSIDRENNNGNYTFDNCRFIELEENICKDKRIAIIQFTLDGTYIKEWISISDAARELTLQTSNITKVLKGHRNHTGVFIWKYKNDKS